MEQWIQFQTEDSSYIVLLNEIMQVKYSKGNTSEGTEAYLQIHYINVPTLIIEGPSATDVWNYLETRDEITVIESSLEPFPEERQHDDDS